MLLADRSRVRSTSEPDVARGLERSLPPTTATPFRAVAAAVVVATAVPFRAAEAATAFNLERTSRAGAEFSMRVEGAGVASVFKLVAGAGELLGELLLVDGGAATSGIPAALLLLLLLPP